MAKKRRSKQFKRSSRVIDMDEARQQRLEKRRKAQLDVPQEQTTSSQRKVRRKRALRKKQSRHRMLMSIAAAILLVFLCVSIFNILKLKAEEHEALKRQDELKAKQEQLKEDLKEADTEQNIEDQARERLKLTKPGETIYIPDSEDTVDGETGTDTNDGAEEQ